MEDGGNKHSIIDNPNNVTGTFLGSKATYPGAYGTGLDMEYTLTKSKLKKTFIVQNNTSLPTPPANILNGTNPSLNLEIKFQASSDLDIYLNGELWDKNTTKTTQGTKVVRNGNKEVEGGKIEFRKEGTTIFSWSTPTYKDSNPTGEFQIANYELKKRGNNLLVSIIIPYSWLSDPTRVYPIYIDPTFEDSTARTITSTEELANTGFETNLASWDDYEDIVSSLSPLHWWKMDEASGNIADSGSSAVTGTLSGNPTYRADSSFSGFPYMITFNGSSDYFNLSDNVDIAGTDSFSLLTFTKHASNTDSDYVLATLDSAPNYKGYTTGLSSGKIWIQLIHDYNPSPKRTIEKSGATTLTTNTSYYLAWTYDGSLTAAGAKLYVNGAEDTAYTTNHDGLQAGDSFAQARNKLIGATSVAAGSPQHFFNGSFGQVAFFNKVLSLTELNTVYMLANGGVTRDTTTTYNSKP